VGLTNSRWVRRHARFAVITVLACAMLMAACTRGPAADRAQIAVDRTTRQSLQVGGAGQDRLLLAVEPGDVDGSGSIASTVSKEPPPTWPWFAAAGPPHDIQVRARLANPLTLTFAAGKRHAADLPLVLRKAGVDGWYPVAVGDPGGVTRAERSRFSPHLPGWADPTRWFEGVADAIKRWPTGRTTPPVCASSPPTWAEATMPALDILLSCISTNKAGKVERVELMVKNNRAFTQEITIPSRVAYAAVEDQPEPVRKLVRSIAGGRDVVLLPSGKWLTIGFTRPQSTTEVVITPRLSHLALLTELLLQLGELSEERGGGGLVTAVVEIAECYGLESDIPSEALDSGLAAVKNTLTKAADCLIKAAADPKKAIAIAQQVVSLQTSRPLSIVQSDASFNTRVESLAGKLHLAGKLAKGLATAQLARLALVVWQSVGEELGRAFSDDDPASIRLTLTAPPSLCGNLPRCGQVATADVDGDRRPDRIGLARLTDSPDGLQNYSLRVLTARGRLGVARQGPDVIYGEPFFGAAEIDGVAGVELLMRMTSGPHTQWFQMYTWRGTRLIVERNPEIPDGYQRYGWPVDSAFSAAVGLTCDRSYGVASIISTSLTPAGRDYFTNPNARHSGEIKTWRWSETKWIPDGTRPISMRAGTPDFRAVPGWHCPGLPRGIG
jgi:hypothetical protein